MVQRKTTKQYVDVEQIDLFGYGELAPPTLFPVIPVAVEEEPFTDIALPFFGEEAEPVAIEARAMGAIAGAASNLVVSFEPAVLEPEPEVIPELIPEVVPAIEIPEIVTETLRRGPKHVVQPYWKEREFVHRQINPNNKTLLIERRGAGRLAVIPWDLYAAAEFVQYTSGEERVEQLWPHSLWNERPIGRPKGKEGVAGDGRAYFHDGLLLAEAAGAITDRSCCSIPGLYVLMPTFDPELGEARRTASMKREHDSLRFAAAGRRAAAL
jgi:hypothetical protein